MRGITFLCAKNTESIKNKEKTIDNKNKMLYNIIINKVKEIGEVNLCQSLS